MHQVLHSLVICGSLILAISPTGAAHAQQTQDNPVLDARVKQFLASHTDQWYDWNVPSTDGKLLYDIIIKNGYKRALEIGTSTGRSGIWIAWALSKTGGKLTTIEINESRYKEALANFKEAGVAQYIDARLADAHDLVPKLKGPFDFVFSDADKAWYLNYFKAVDPKLEMGGCFTAHNMSMSLPGIREFKDYIRNLPNYKTTINNSSGAGLSISYKEAK